MAKMEGAPANRKVDREQAQKNLTNVEPKDVKHFMEVLKTNEGMNSALRQSYQETIKNYMKELEEKTSKGEELSPEEAELYNEHKKTEEGAEAKESSEQVRSLEDALKKLLDESKGKDKINSELTERIKELEELIKKMGEAKPEKPKTAEEMQEELKAHVKDLETQSRNIEDLVKKISSDSTIDTTKLPESVKKMLSAFNGEGSAGKKIDKPLEDEDLIAANLKNLEERFGETEKSVEKDEIDVNKMSMNELKEYAQLLESSYKKAQELGKNVYEDKNIDFNSLPDSVKNLLTAMMQYEMYDEAKKEDGERSKAEAKGEEYTEEEYKEAHKMNEEFDIAKKGGEYTEEEYDEATKMNKEFDIAKKGGEYTEAEYDEAMKMNEEFDRAASELIGEANYEELSNKRNSYLRAKLDLKNFERFKGIIPKDKLDLAYEKAREEYKEALYKYAKLALAEKREFLKKSGYEGADLECELSLYKATLFNTLVVDEVDFANRFECENMEPKERGLCGRLWDKWRNVKGWKKVLIGGIIGGGIVASGAIAGGAPIGAAIMYGGWRLLKSAASALGAGAVFKMGNSLANKSFDKARNAGIESQSALFSRDVERNMENKQQFWDFLQQHNATYQETLARAGRRRRNWNIGTALGAAAVGAGIYGGLSHYDTNVHDFLYGKSKTPAAVVAVAENTGGKKPGIAEGGEGHKHPVVPGLEHTPRGEHHGAAAAAGPEGTPGAQPGAGTPAPESVPEGGQPGPMQPETGTNAGDFGRGGGATSAFEQASNVPSIGIDDMQRFLADRMHLFSNDPSITNNLGKTLGEVMGDNFVKTAEVGGPGFDSMQNGIALQRELGKLIQQVPYQQQQYFYGRPVSELIEAYMKKPF